MKPNSNSGIRFLGSVSCVSNNVPGSLLQWRGLKPQRKQQFTVYEGRSMKMLEVTGVRPEAGRSNPGQGEAEVKFRGGLKSCYEQVFL